MSQLRVEQLRTPLVGPVEFGIGAGECLCLSGPSGSGKSLLLRAIADLDPHDGEIYLDGQPCSAMAATDWRRRVGLLAADSQWWAPQVGQHFPDGSAPEVEALGFGPEVLGWSVERMSTGERQRLALARLLCNEPQVLLLDEPTANLDVHTAIRVERLIADYRASRQAAVLWVTHDPAQIQRVADRVMYLTDGRLQAA